MSKLAIAVKSCNEDMRRGCHAAIRETWGKDARALGIDVFFFVGIDPRIVNARLQHRYESDEKVLDCNDDYFNLPAKTRRICQWGVNKTYDHLFFCDVDTFIKPTALRALDYQMWDYAGKFNVPDRYPGCAPFRYQDQHGIYNECRAWASGGWGYFLSHRAAGIVGNTYPSVWAEDMFVGHALAKGIDQHMLKATHLDNLVYGATWHWPKTGIPYEPKYMRWAQELGNFTEIFRQGRLVAA
jgi:hypothetical protein